MNGILLRPLQIKCQAITATAPVAERLEEWEGT